MNLSTLLACPVICFVVLAAHPLFAQTSDDANKAKLEERDQLSKQAFHAAREGKFGEAASLFEQVYALEESIFGPSHIELIGTLGILTQVAEAKNDFQAIIDYRKRLQQVTEQLYGKNDYRTKDATRAVDEATFLDQLTTEQKALLVEARQLKVAMNQNRDANRYDDAARSGFQCLEIQRSVFGENHLNCAQSAEELGVLHFWYKRDSATAIPLLQIALEIKGKTIGTDHPSYAICECSLGDCYRLTGNRSAASPLLQEAERTLKQFHADFSSDYERSINNLALLHMESGDFRKAKSLLLKLVKIRKESLGEQHPAYVLSMNYLAEVYMSCGDWDDATASYEQLFELKKIAVGQSHPDILEILERLCGVAESKNDFQTINNYRERQRYIVEELYGKDDYRTEDATRAVDEATYLSQLTADQKAQLVEARQLKIAMNQNRDANRYDDAVKSGSRCLEIQRSVFGANHLHCAQTAEELGVIHFWHKRDSASAIPLLRNSLEIKRQILGDKHPSYAISQRNLGDCYRFMSDFPNARPYLEGAEGTLRRFQDELPKEFCISVNNLALLFFESGDYKKAEPLLVKSLELISESFGTQNRTYAISLDNLAVLYISMGDYALAEPLYTQALAIRNAVLGDQHPDYADSLINLARLYSLMRDYTRAEPLYNQALKIRETVLGDQHPDYAICLNHLAWLYGEMGDYARAEPLCKQALEIQGTVLGEQHPAFASSLNILADLYRLMGDYPRAEPLFLKSLEIYKATLGERHLSYANSLNNLAGLYRSTGDIIRAEPLFREAVEIILDNLESAADVQSQRQQVSMGELLRHRLDSYLSLATGESKFQETAYAVLLRWKGSVWQRQQRQRLLIDQPELKPRFAALQAVASKLSTLILNPPDPKQQEAWRRQLEELTDEREKLERDLSLASVAFRQASTPVTPEHLRGSLPEGTMLVDFLEYRHFTPANQEQQTKESYERHLLVHLIRAGQDVRAIDLGDVASLQTWVQTWRRDLGQSPDAIDAARELRKRIWEPLEEHLTGITTVYVSPDGLLGQFPLAALPGKQPGSYLLEEMSIVMLPVPQGLPAMATTSLPSTNSTNDRFCLVGGVDYEQVTAPDTPTSPTTPATPAGPLMLAARGGEWQAFGALPGTAVEIDTIESLIRTHQGATQTTILRGGMASEAAFTRNAPGNRYLHIATHGFFAPETVQNAMTASTPSPERMMMGDSESRAPKLVGQHPDLLSGLVFAGANHEPQPGTDDGILTAAEVQSLDLRGVDLAVLSACETGLGRTAGGEGIIGLQRAFQLAGARTTITSLWKVDDAATQALMVEFYRNLFEKKLSKLESLRQAQIWLLNNPDVIEGLDLTTRGSVRPINITADTKTTADKPTRSLPAYWAAFQLSGDPR